MVKCSDLWHSLVQCTRGNCENLPRSVPCYLEFSADANSNPFSIGAPRTLRFLFAFFSGILSDIEM